jgi:CubicO group peptidase (beta-lactamase class C family)
VEEVPVSGAFSIQGLDQFDAALAARVDAGELPGLVALLARGDEVHTASVGTIAFTDATPMAPDTVMRIASLTKPVAAAAAMLLVDQGRLRLDEPVDRLLPELAGRRVLRRIDAELDETVPADRPITVEDLLTFRLGFGSMMLPPGSTPVQRAEEELQLMTLGPPWPPPPFGPDEWIARFATLPLIAQPGERWLYNTGAQVLGVLIERAAGIPLEQFLAAGLFEPLGMADTSFSWPPHARGRLATAYAPDGGGKAVLFDGPDGYWARPPVFPNAAGWLVSTVEDYWAFARLLNDGGVHRGRRVLSAASVAAMTTDHLSAAQRRDAELFIDGSGWGYCMAAPPADGAGERIAGYGWEGGSGTTWRTDPATGLTGILFTQLQVVSPEPSAVYVDFWAAARAALT